MIYTDLLRRGKEGRRGVGMIELCKMNDNLLFYLVLIFCIFLGIYTGYSYFLDVIYLCVHFSRVE